MKEIDSLLQRARRYLKSAGMLLKYTFVISRTEAEELLENGEGFVQRMVQHLREEGML